MLAFLTALLLAGAPADAYYRAEPAAAPAQARLVAGELLWRCGPDGCLAGRSDSRPVVDCQALARAVGRMKSFTVAGAPLAADQLEKCNARAR